MKARTYRNLCMLGEVACLAGVLYTTSVVIRAIPFFTKLSQVEEINQENLALKDQAYNACRDLRSLNPNDPNYAEQRRILRNKAERGLKSLVNNSSEAQDLLSPLLEK